MARKQMTLTVTEQEHATILAALRLYQRWLEQGLALGQPIEDIATSMGELVALDADDIDKLCEAINTAEEPPPPPDRTARFRRVWINQPSTLQPAHRLHGRRGLVWDDGAAIVGVYFVDGDESSCSVPRIALSEATGSAGGVLGPPHVPPVQSPLSDVLRQYGATEPDDLALVAWARKNLVEEGVLEIDDAVVSRSPEEDGGYVLCWAWVSDDDARGCA